MNELIKEIVAANSHDEKFDAYSKHCRNHEGSAKDNLRALHVNTKLTDAKRFHWYGNGLGKSLKGELVLSVGKPRWEGKRNVREAGGRKCSDFLRQDAHDAIIALANIAERPAPFIWRDNKELAILKTTSIQSETEYGAIRSVESENPKDYTYPIEKLRCNLDAPSGEIIRDEVGKFIDQYGLLHMPSQGCGFDNDSWLHPHAIRFIDEDSVPASLEAFKKTLKKKFREQVSKEMGACSDNESAPEEARKKAGERVVAFMYRKMEREGSKNSEDLYAAWLLPFAKDFSWMGDFEARHALLLKEASEIEVKIESLNRRRRISDDPAEIDRLYREIGDLQNQCHLLHSNFEYNDIVKAARKACEFVGSDKESLQSFGFWTVNMYAYYYAALLMRDALEMHAAIQGDEDALSRLLPKFHMEVYDSEDEKAWLAEDRYTLWFESIGYDTDNPVSNRWGHQYTWNENGHSIALERRESRTEESYGGGWRFYHLCKRGEGPRQFREAVKKHLPRFLDMLIREGMSHNYKGRFAPPDSGINKKKPFIKVNDLGCDLFATLWSVFDLINKGLLKLEYTRCKVCGRYVQVKRNQNPNRQRKTCSDACRKKTSRESLPIEDIELREDYLAYAASGADIKIGTQEEDVEKEPIIE